MRRGLIALSLVCAGCASAALPPGGPEDHAPPKLLGVSPDTNAVNVKDRWAEFRFDETINDRGSGAQEISNFFLVSPSEGANHVEWHRSRIDVRPRNGFRPNTAYTVTLLPGLGDLRGNVMKTGQSVVFSTGSTIPKLAITGQVFDWMAERPAARALIQAVTPDSLVYLAQSDSAGKFTVGPLPEGTYLVRAIVDANNNRALDRNEMYDSARVVTPQPKPIELLAIQRDTLPPRVTSVTQGDSLTLRVSFDRPIRATEVPPLAAFRLVGPDSASIPLVALFTPRQEQDSAKALQKAAADSARRADSVAGKAPAPVPPPAAPVAGARPGARTVAAPLDTPSVRPPVTQLVIKLARPLAPSTTYRLYATNVKSLSGRVGSSERSFSTPKPPPPPKTPAPKPATTDTTPAATRPATQPQPTPRPVPPAPKP